MLKINGQRTLKLLAVALVMVLFFSGIALGFVVGYSRGLMSEQARWSGGDWGKLNQVLHYIENNFIHEYDRERMLEGALHGLLDSLGDPFSGYLSPEELHEMQIQSGDSYSGIGVEVTMENNRITILAPFRGSPAEEAGLMPGDQIVEVDGLSLEGMTLSQAVKYIRGEAGTSLTLGIIREGRPNIFRVSLIRAQITRPSVEFDMLANGIGYLYLSRFAENSGNEFTQALTQLKSQGLQGLVLDIRGNPGGYVDVAVDIARQLVPQGLIFYTEDKDGNRISEFRSNLKDRGFELVVLIDGRSASASELLAGALQDAGGVDIVGVNSYGKGTVQRFYNLGDGSVVKLTMARFYSPSGHRIDGNGITPNHIIEMDDAILLPELRFTGTLELGSTSLNVILLQRLLTALEYYAGEPSGVYDQNTAEAVSAFQRANALAVTGKVDLVTTERINLRWESFKRDADIQLNKALELIRQKTN